MITKEEALNSLWGPMELSIDALKQLIKPLKKAAKEKNGAKFGELIAEALNTTIECHVRNGAIGAIEEIEEMQKK
jgi:hypothetical protein